MTEKTPSLSFHSAYQPLPLQAKLRQKHSDFIVRETLGFMPSGDGEHWLVSIEKTGQNTQWVATQIAKLLGIKPHAVGYCGRKDRHAVTTQWLSIHLPGQPEPNWEQLNIEENIEGCKLLDTARHHKKLRPGMHAANTFELRLTELHMTPSTQAPSAQAPSAQAPSAQATAATLAESAATQAALEKRLKQIAHQGLPNYFGPQRFGRQGMNLVHAQRWLVENKAPRRDQRSIILSGARAYLFNLVLSARVSQNLWCALIPGDVAIDNCPSGPLWGRGRSASTDRALKIENDALCDYKDWLNSLEHKGLNQERRAFVLQPKGLEYQLEGFSAAEIQNGNAATLSIKFELCTGAFATAVLSEILSIEDCASNHASN